MNGLRLRLVSGYEPMSDQAGMCLSVSNGELETAITLAADKDGTFKPSDISAMLRTFAETIDRKYKEPA